jgi:hypothetical protein
MWWVRREKTESLNWIRSWKGLLAKRGSLTVLEVAVVAIERIAPLAVVHVEGRKR